MRPRITCHLIKQGADHGTFEVVTKCEKTIDTYGNKTPLTWTSHEVTCEACLAEMAKTMVPCRKCAKYLAKPNPNWGLCDLCGGKLLEHNFKKYGKGPKNFHLWDDDWE